MDLSVLQDEVLALGELLRSRRQMLATAESCTGGLIAAACTSVAGSSDWFDRGVVSYSYPAKSDQLDVPADLIATHGAVSEPVALAMAEGVRQRSTATWAVAVTGIAGPGGAVPGKPVGTVVIAWAGPHGAQARRFQFAGDRAAVREATVHQALDGLMARLRQSS